VAAALIAIASAIDRAVIRGAVWDCASAFCSVAAMEEVALSKTYENTRPDFVERTKPRRAFLQFLHHNHTPSPLAGLCGVLFCSMVSRFAG
jgi:hypothetical protein